MLSVNKLQKEAYAHFKKGAIYKSEETVVSAIKLLNSIPQSSFSIQTKTGLYNHLGRIYRNFGNRDSALEYYQRSLELNNNICDSIANINNIANIFSDQGLHKEAVKTLRVIHNKISKLDSCDGKWEVIDNLGFNESKLKKPEGLEKMKIALKARIKDSLFEGMFSSYRHLSIHFMDRKKNDSAEYYVKKAIKIARKIESPFFLNKALYLKLKLRKDEEILKYLFLNDSIQNADKQTENKYVNKKYDTTKSEKKALKEELEKERQQRKALLFAFLGGLILIAAIFFILLQRNRNKQYTLAQVHKTERNLSKKVHDELGNDIFYLMNQLQTNPASLLEKEGLQILNGLNEIYVKARDISKKYTTINTDNGYHDELLSLLNSFGSDTTKIVTNEVTSDFWQPVSKLKKEQLYRVLQELLTNMKKHSEAELVGITFTKVKKQFIIKYVDNGKGATRDELLAKNGLGNVENRIEEIKGTITFDTNPDNGFKAEIRFIQ
ncbi:MAG: tetratricopeptide repeat protein [Bacteroidota bacterium]